MPGTEQSGWKLKELSDYLGGFLVQGRQPESAISAVHDSSRGNLQNALFVAIRGHSLDGHDCLRQAFENGAVAAVVADQAKLSGCSGIVVSDTRLALSRLAALFAGNPSASLAVIGITGTNGKTTVNWLLYHVLNALGWSCMRVGTLGVDSKVGVSQAGDLTTPATVALHGALQQALRRGANSCVMEVSSHALAQARVDNIAFDVAAFTNLSRDHLDYHLDMESYFAAKSRLFELLAAGGKSARAAVINAGCAYGRRLCDKLKSWGLKDFSFAAYPAGRVAIKEFRQNMQGSCTELLFEGCSYYAKCGLIGRHNAENIAAAFACLMALDFNAQQVSEAFERVPQVPGRLELIAGRGLSVYVDYSHTPDALERALLCLRQIGPAKLWVVFGCGGDRDRGKRPQMADVAARHADYVAVTSDNPRSEDPERIIDDILNAASGAHIRKTGVIEPDRRRAIEMVLQRAAPGDVVLIAGKGHEDYQIIGAEKIHFSDQEEVRRALGAVCR